MQVYLPSKILCSCFQPRGKTRIFVDSYRKLLKEISITKILRTIRVLKAKAKNGMTKDEWNLLKNKNSHLDYDSDHKARKSIARSREKDPDFFGDLVGENDKVEQISFNLNVA